MLGQQNNSEDQLSTVKNIMGLLSSDSDSRQDLGNVATYPRELAR
jgi:hypothetical protein